MDRLADDSKRVFLDKNREEDMQKAALHASRAAQIARRHKLVSTKEGTSASLLVRNAPARLGLSGGAWFVEGRSPSFCMYVRPGSDSIMLCCVSCTSL
jgi:hypothetical protein